MSDTPISNGAEELVGILKAADLHATAQIRSDTKDRCIVQWAGAQDGLVVYEVSVIAAAYHMTGDLFTTAWNAIADPDHPGWTPLPASVGVVRNERPLGAKDPADFAVFDVLSNISIDPRGL